MQQNKTTLQVTCSNPNLVVENNFNGSLDEPGILNKQLIFGNVKDEIVQLATYSQSIFYLNSKNELYFGGHNGSGVGGVGHKNEVTSFTKSASGVKKVNIGSGLALYLDFNGNLYGAGYALNLGMSNNTSYKTTWTKRASNIRDIGGTQASWYITNNNDLYVGGQGGNYGEKGYSEANNIKFIKTASNVKCVSAGTQCSCYIDLSDNLYFTGSKTSLGLSGKQTTWTKIADNAKMVSCGAVHFAYIDNNNDLFTIGDNYYGQLGIGSTTDSSVFNKVASNVKYVVCGTGCTAYITFDNDLYICGIQTVQGSSNKQSNRFVKRASNVRCVAISNDNCWYATYDNKLMGTGVGHYYGFANNSTSNHYTFTDFSRYTDFWSCDGVYTNPSIYNISIQGTPQIGDILNLKFTTVPSTQTTLTVKTSNPTLTVKNNYTGTLEETGIVTESFTYGIGYNQLKAKVTKDSICYVDSFGDLYLRGKFENGSGGDGTLDTVVHNDVKKASDVKQVGGSYDNTYYITNSGDLYVAGKNTYGQLATGNTENVLTFTKVAENVKDAYLFNHLMYIKENGDLYVCGKNTYGQLGLGNQVDTAIPTKVASNVDYMASNGENSWYISKGELYGCGENAKGQQGSGDTNYITTFVKRAENVKLVNAASYTTQYITNDNKLFGCGIRKDNLLFNGETEAGSYHEFIHCADDIKHMCATNSIQYYVKTNGDLYVVGDNTNGFYGDGESTPTSQTSGSTPVKVAENVDKVGYCHYYDMQGHLFLCGDNSHGQIMQAVQTFNLRATEVPTTNVPWTDVTPSEEGWLDENENLINLGKIGVEIEGDPEIGDTVELKFSTRRLQPVGLSLEHGDRIGLRFMTSDQYEQQLAEDKVTGNLIYALADAKILMLQNNPYTAKTEFVDTYPDRPYQGIIYVNSVTRGIRTYNGSDWNIIIPDVETVLTEETLGENLLTAKAIKDFIDPDINEQLIADVTYNDTLNVFTVKQIDGETRELPLAHIVSSVTYDDGVLSFNKLGTEADVINLPKENYLVDASFDGRIITMNLKDGAVVSVDLLDLIDIYLGVETQTAIVKIENQELQVEVKLSEQAGNAIANVDGLYVPEHLIKSITSNNIIEVSNSEALQMGVNISQQEGNTLEVREDGLFSAKVDTENYYDKLESDTLLMAKKDLGAFNSEIALKVDPETVYGREEQYTIPEVDTYKTWNPLKEG